MKFVELKGILMFRGLRVSGKKSELVQESLLPKNSKQLKEEADLKKNSLLADFHPNIFSIYL